MPGGDVVCMNKQNGGIWFWFHDLQGDDFMLAANSFEEFILKFEKREITLSNSSVTWNLNEKDYAIMKAAAEEVKKKYK